MKHVGFLMLLLLMVMCGCTHRQYSHLTNLTPLKKKSTPALSLEYRSPNNHKLLSFETSVKQPFLLDSIIPSTSQPHIIISPIKFRLLHKFTSKQTFPISRELTNESRFHKRTLLPGMLNKVEPQLRQTKNAVPKADATEWVLIFLLFVLAGTLVWYAYVSLGPGCAILLVVFGLLMGLLALLAN